MATGAEPRDTQNAVWQMADRMLRAGARAVRDAVQLTMGRAG